MIGARLRPARAMLGASRKIRRPRMAKMNVRALAGAVIGATAVAGALALIDNNTGSTASEPTAKGQEQCYGVAKAGENGCAAANGSHSCGGLAKIDFSGQEWKLVEAGTCTQMGGQLQAFERPTPASDETKG